MKAEESPRLDRAPEPAGLPETATPDPGEAGEGLLPGLDDGRSAGEQLEELAALLGFGLPADPAEAALALAGSLVETRREADEYLTVIQRIAADFDNYRKRVERDQAGTVARAAQRLVERLLPTLDSFDAALAYDAQTPAEERLLEGLRSTHSQLMDVLTSEGLARIAALGRPFDPAVHEAVAGPQEGSGDGPLVVTQELRGGYTLKDRVVRPSLVVVDRG